MTAIDVLTQKLVALGATTEMIVLVVEAVTVARDGHKVTRDKRDMSHFVTPEDVRTAAKMRKRKQREKEHLQRLAAAEAQANDGANAAVTVTRDTCDMSQNRTDLLSSFSSSVEEVIAEGSKKKRKKESTENARARGQRMLTGAILTDEFRQAAIDLGADPLRISEVWVEFVDYWVAIPGARGLKTDWPATWRNRVRNVLQRGKPNGRPRQQSLSDLARDIADEARRRGH